VLFARCRRRAKGLAITRKQVRAANRRLLDRPLVAANMETGGSGTSAESSRVASFIGPVHMKLYDKLSDYI